MIGIGKSLAAAFAGREAPPLPNLGEVAAMVYRHAELRAGLDSETHGLRVFVSGGGCSGLQYGMTFDDNPRPVDSVFEQHGMRIIIDPQSRQYMEGASIDYVDSLMGGGFHIENPNAVSSCGCGHSFRSKDGAEGGGGCSSCH